MILPHVSAIDSHTGGEPTRVVYSGGPDLGDGTMAERFERFRTGHDDFRSAVVNEPRGSDVLVGALLCPPSTKENCAGVIFFNNVGYLGMCGHGTIGLMVTLAHLGRIKTGDHRIETPVGTITASLLDDGSVSITNVPSYRTARSVEVQVPEIGLVTGDVAWGGNWFFLVRTVPASQKPALIKNNAEALTHLSWKIRQAVNAQGFPEIDHVELFDQAENKVHHSRNFVLCPGKAYDRSPCGTGTSAKLACLAADGSLDENATWIQESILGSTFKASYRWLDRSAGRILPTINGTAHVVSRLELILDSQDPFCWGIRG